MREARVGWIGRRWNWLGKHWFTLYTWFAGASGAAIFALMVASLIAPSLWGSALGLPEDPGARASLLQSWRLILVTALAVAVGALTVPFVIQRALVADRQAAAAEATAATAARNAKTAEDGHVTDRIIRATELLGRTHDALDEVGEKRTVPTVEVRLGAIYTLERVARESLDDHLAIMETLAAYIRENAERHPLKDAPGQDEDTPEAERRKIRRLGEDVRAALSVIHRRSREQRQTEITAERAFDWSKIPLPNADLRDVFPPRPKARVEDLPHERAFSWDLRAALLPDADLRRFTLAFAQLQGAKLHLAQLQGAQLQRAQLQRAQLQGAQLQRAQLHLAQLQRAELQRAQLQGAELHLAQLQGAELQRAQLQGAELHRASLVGVRLRGAAPGAEDAVEDLVQEQIDGVFGDEITRREIQALGLRVPEPDDWFAGVLEDPEQAYEAWVKWREARGEDR